MHDTAMALGRAFFSSYLGTSGKTGIEILDVGGLDVNGTLRTAADSRWRYLSVDMTPGKGVDIVLDDPYQLPFPDERFDATISTSCFEHDALFWLTFLEMCRTTRTGGYIYLNVPSDGHFHRYPIDAWRFYPDAGLALVEWGRRSGVQLTLCESFVANEGAGGWSDFVAIFRKGSPADAAVPPIYKTISCRNVHHFASDTILAFEAEVARGARPSKTQARAKSSAFRRLVSFVRRRLG